MSAESSVVEVQLEIGHRATPKHKKTPDGHTHDWTVFIRGTDNSHIEIFVEKVIFHLHESFPKPKRVIKEPPYQLTETGYASFEIPIEVYFRNKEEPKLLVFDYDLFLDLGRPVYKLKREKLTFQNPSPDFRKKLLKGGGKTLSVGTPPDDDHSSGSPSESHSQVNKLSAASCSSSTTFSTSSGPASLSTKTSTCKPNKSASESIPQSGNGSNTSRREKSSKESSRNKHRNASPAPSQLTSGTASSFSSANPPSNGTSSSRDATIKEAKTKTSTPHGGATPLADTQFTDLFGPPIQTRPPPSSDVISASRTPNNDTGPGNASTKGKKNGKTGAQSKSKGASNSFSKSSTTSSFNGSKEALFSQQNELKSSSKASSGAGTSSTTASTSSSSVRTVSQQAQLSAKREHASSKHSKVFSGPTDSSSNPSRPSSDASFTKESKESSKERLSFSASQLKKENVTSKSTSKSSSRAETTATKKPAQESKKKSKTANLAAECSVLSPAEVSVSKDAEGSSKKSKSKKDSARDRSSSKSQSSKVKVDEDDESTSGGGSSKKHKSKEKDKAKKERARKKAHSSSEESEDSGASDDERHDPESAKFSKSKVKRRRHDSGSSTSSVLGANHDWLKASPGKTAYMYHPQAAASMAKRAMTLDSSKLYPSKEMRAERKKQKLLADSVGGHFPSLLHNPKLNQQSPSSLFSDGSFSTPVSGAQHSPNLASPALSASPSPSQKMISSKASHLHEDSNGSNGSNTGGLLSKKESSSSSKKLSKISKDVLNNSSGTETSHLMSTKIKYRDDNSVTTIEIKSINKEKTWDSSNEIKKHKTTKESSKSSSSSSKRLDAGSAKSQPPRDKGNKYKYLFKKRKSNSGGNSKNSAERDSDHSSDSDSSSQSSESDSSSEESDHEEEVVPPKEAEKHSTPRPTPPVSSLSPQTTPNSRLPASNIYSRTSSNHAPQHSPFERLYQNISGYGTEHTPLRHSSLSPVATNSLSYSEVMELQGKIAQLADSDLLQQVIDLVEERQSSNCFNIVNDCLQFDLLKLEKTTLIEIKRLIC